MAFLFRTIATKHQQSSGLELTSSLFILLAPLRGFPLSLPETH
jgi:hypothetical protein